MNPTLTFVAVAALLIGVRWWGRRGSIVRSDWGKPIWGAFTFTAASALFLVTGLIGYTLSKHDRFIAGTPWAGAIVWPQVWMGLAFLVIAAVCWRLSWQSPAFGRSMPKDW